MKPFSDAETQYFEVLLQLHQSEQSHYWARFVAFSAILTGLIVLYATTDQKGFVALAGSVTSVFWAGIQLKSWTYVRSSKEAFHTLFSEYEQAAIREREQAGKSGFSDTKGVMAKRVDGLRSTTELALWFVGVVLVFWLLLLLGVAK